MSVTATGPSTKEFINLAIMFGAFTKRPPVRAVVQTVVSNAFSSSSRRFLSLHEYQAQGLLAEYGIKVPVGRAATSVDEVGAAVDALGGSAVLKSQILAGGRGKGHFDSGLKSGVHVVSR